VKEGMSVGLHRLVGPGAVPDGLSATRRMIWRVALWRIALGHWELLYGGRVLELQRLARRHWR
jgi:hypothetical protein